MDESSVLPIDQGEAMDAIARVAKALGHPMRVRIMRLLLGREACMCGQIVAELPLSQATVSQHLKVLKDAGLIRGDIDGPRVCYCAETDTLERHLGLVSALLTNEPLEQRMEVAR
ncbi:MAG: metalloregulator ArsR/SmtB family transcription factor [Thermoleophilia bacterium]